jgi:hypothetical protein
MKKKIINSILMLFSVSLLSVSCNKMDTITRNYSSQKRNGNGSTSPDMVLRWNDAATYVVIRTLQLQATPRIPPFRESHYYAMVNLAVHDALNNIVPRYESYALHARNRNADPDAAVAQAAHDVISFFFGKLNPPANITPQEVQDYIHNLLS